MLGRVVIPPCLGGIGIPAAQICATTLLSKEFSHPLLKETVFVQICNSARIRIRTAEIPASHTVDDVARCLLVPRTVFAFSHHIFNLGKTHYDIIRIEFQGPVGEIRNRSFYKTDSRVLFSRRDIGRKFRYGIVFRSHLLELGHLVNKGDDLSHIFSLTLAGYGSSV